MARQFAMVVVESSFGVPKTSPTLGTDSFYIPITEGNAVNVWETPLQGKIPYGGGWNTSSCAFSNQSQIQGTIKTNLYSTALTKFLLDVSLTQVNSGRTTPWPTTDANYVMPAGDLPSFTCYFGHEQVDGTIKRYGWHGLKVASGSISLASGQTAGTISLNVAGAGTSTPNSTTFPEPDSSAFPCSVYTFSDLDGGLKIGTTRSLFGGLELSWTNSINTVYFEGKYPKIQRYTGRSTTVNVSQLYMRPTPDDYSSYKSLTPFDGQVKLDDGVNTLTLDLPVVRWDSLTPEFGLDTAYSWNGTLAAYYDATSGTDVLVSFAANTPPGGGD